MSTVDESAHDARWHFPLLGLDISEKRIGLALAELAEVFPRPLFTYARITRERDLAQCSEWARRYDAGGVVIGLPVNMDGTEGPRARWMRRFARQLQERIATPVILQDERLTTVEADELLGDRGESNARRAESIDAVAAAVILRRFLTEQRANSKGEA
ncbi:MAG: Holliday junction resolvase RuvX [Armatimonadota bacterium]